MNPNPIRLAIATFIIVVTPTPAISRSIDLKTYEQLLAESDVVVIVHALSTRNTKPGDDVVTLEREDDSLEPVCTRFRTLALLKGRITTREFDLCHYRYDESKRVSTIANGPMLVEFLAHSNKGEEWKEWMGPGNDDYILFLVRDDSDRLTFVTGQFDPERSVRRLTSSPGPKLRTIGCN